MKGKTIIFILVAIGLIIYLVISRKTSPEANTQNSEKLDIVAVCQGALAYMTFPDGESADLFVAECIDGKHPDVIEKFKADNNLGDGSTV